MSFTHYLLFSVYEVNVACIIHFICKVSCYLLLLKRLFEIGNRLQYHIQVWFQFVWICCTWTRSVNCERFTKTLLENSLIWRKHCSLHHKFIWCVMPAFMKVAIICSALGLNHKNGNVQSYKFGIRDLKVQGKVRVIKL